MPPEFKKIIWYVRVSTSAQNYTSQEGALAQYCEARGWKPVDYTILREKVSGSGKSRPVLDSILTAARTGAIKTVLVYKMDRLGRSVSHLSWVITELQRMGVGLICTSQGIDTSTDTPMGKMQANMLAAFAEFDRDCIRDRVKSGLAAARKRGSIIGRPRTSDKFKDDAFKLRGKGKTFQEIGKALGISEATAYRLAKKAPGPKVIRATKRPRPRKYRPSKSSPLNQASLPL